VREEKVTDMPNQPGMSVTGKVLALLGAFSHEAPALTLTELSRRTGLSVPTVHRRAAELVEWGALERGLDGRYRIGLRLWEVASLAPRSSGLRNAARPVLQDLYDPAKAQHIHLSVRDHLEIVFLERLSAPDAPQAETRAGGRFGAFATGAGLVLLAHAPVEVQEEYLSKPLRRYTANTVTDPARIRSLLGGVRKNKYSTSDRMLSSDVQCVGAPIRGVDGSVVAAVSVCFQAGSQSFRTAATSVQAAAQRISHALR
jgi:DNA-binding IclR family transcriptional regulator